MHSEPVAMMLLIYVKSRTFWVSCPGPAALQVIPDKTGAHRVAALLFKQRVPAPQPQAVPVSRCGFEVRLSSLSAHSFGQEVVKLQMHHCSVWSDSKADAGCAVCPLCSGFGQRTWICCCIVHDSWRGMARRRSDSQTQTAWGSQSPACTSTSCMTRALAKSERSA